MIVLATEIDAEMLRFANLRQARTERRRVRNDARGMRASAADVSLSLLLLLLLLLLSGYFCVGGIWSESESRCNVCAGQCSALARISCRECMHRMYARLAAIGMDRMCKSRRANDLDMMADTAAFFQQVKTAIRHALPPNPSSESKNASPPPSPPPPSVSASPAPSTPPCSRLLGFVPKFPRPSSPWHLEVAEAAAPPASP